MKNVSLTPAVFHLPDAVNAVSAGYPANPVVPRGPKLKPLLHRVQAKVGKALGSAEELRALLSASERNALQEFLLEQQYRELHPYTGAAPGGWAWTDLPGGVPDADDTAGALLALARLDVASPAVRSAATAGLRWLLDLQNRDGGIPTFCRGWGRLPFDRSGADLSAHVLRALKAWEKELVSDKGVFADDSTGFERVVQQGFQYLDEQQNADGSWYPLWFGNQDHPQEENPVYGTSKVLLAYIMWGHSSAQAANRGFQWLVTNQNDDGGWRSGVAHQRLANGKILNKRDGSSVEETALALETLMHSPDPTHQAEAVEKGLAWLIDRVETGRYVDCSPIGFYFAKLWYHERLYPLIFTVSALGTALSRANNSAANPISATDIQ